MMDRPASPSSAHVSGRRALRVALAAAAVSWGAFAVLALLVQGNAAEAADDAMLALLPAGAPPSWAPDMARDLTALGSNAVVLLTGWAAALYLWLTRRPGGALHLLLCIAGASMLADFMKEAFDRVRPDTAAALSVQLDSSFPSGHATLAAAAYLTLGVIFASSGVRSVRILVMAVAIATALIVGVTRVYLGAHWPTDVAGGLTLGAGWAMSCWAAAILVRRFGAQ